MNSITLHGRLSKDPEQRQTSSGTAVTNFTVAVDRKLSKEKTADFIDCVAWNKTAEIISKHFKKGKEIVVRGRLESRKWEDKDSNKRLSWEVVVDDFDFCGSRSESTAAVSDSTTPEFTEANDVSDDELPF